MSIIGNLFRRRRPKDPEALVQERWETSFRWTGRHKFPQETHPKYECAVRKRALVLDLKQASLFAWVTNRLYRYRDFMIEATILPSAENAYSAAGFVLRFLDDENFYYFLVSNRGFYRFDLVFNGNPIPLIEWTRSPYLNEGNESIEVRIIVRSSSFFFFAGDAWIGEVSDDTLGEGRIGFAGQNFDEKETARFYLKHLLVESRPVEVEKAFFRWTRYIPVDPRSRNVLAETFYAMGQFRAAVAQIRKELQGREGHVDEYLLLAEALINLENYEEALGVVEKTLELDPDRREALQEKANLLYLLNRQDEAMDFLHEILPRFPAHASLINMLGNVENSLGNWEAALSSYGRAASLDPDMPIYRLNMAKTMELSGKRRESLEHYTEAARMFLRQEAYGEIRPILAKIKGIDPGNPEAIALAGKLLFYEGKTDVAARLFDRLMSSGYEKDSSIFFLSGVILSERSKRRESLKYFRQADRLEPDVPQYRFRIAETLFLLDEDPRADLERAYELAPDDPWTNNLFGQYLQKKGETARAEEYFARAYELAPAESTIMINYTDCLAKRGRLDEALRIAGMAIKEGSGTADVKNQMGNLFVLEGDLSRALLAYEDALRSDPDNPDYSRNCASVCIELDMIMRAEDLLTSLLGSSPSPETYNLVANLALVKREYQRAEAALQQGLEMDPDNIELKLNRASLYLEMRRVGEAKETLEEILTAGTEGRTLGPEGRATGEFQGRMQRARALMDRLHRDHEQQITCSSCERVWWVPRDLPPQPTLRIRGEPPGECPAGRCERCRKIYCVACARDHLVDNRFVCAECGDFLKFSDEPLKFLVSRFVQGSDSRGPSFREPGHPGERVRGV